MLHEASDAEEKEMLQADISDNELLRLEEDVKYMSSPATLTTRRTPSSRFARRVGAATRRPSCRCTSAQTSAAQSSWLKN